MGMGMGMGCDAHMQRTAAVMKEVTFDSRINIILVLIFDSIEDGQA